MKKYIYIILFACVYFNVSVAQNKDGINISFDTSLYLEIAEKKLEERISNEEKMESKYSFSFVSNKCKDEKIEVVSIPLFRLNKNAMKYTCETPITLEDMIEFENNPNSQLVLYVCNQKIIGGSTVVENYAKNANDSIIRVYGNPFSYDPQIEKKIYKYMKKNMDSFCFLISEMNGFWVVKDNCLYRLGQFGLQDPNDFVFKNYGEEYIHDVANGELRSGYTYTSCTPFRYNKKLYLRKHIQVNILNDD